MMFIYPPTRILVLSTRLVEFHTSNNLVRIIIFILRDV